MAPGSNWPDAKAGDILINYEDSEKLFPRVPGVTFQPIASVEYAVEWLPERGSRSAPVAHHDFVPAGRRMDCRRDGRKACIGRPNGNRIEKTVFLHMLVDGFKTTFAFKSTAYNIGKSFSSDADKVRVAIDDETVRVCGALWRMISEFERNDRGQTWFCRASKSSAFSASPPGLPSIRFAWRAISDSSSRPKRKSGRRSAASGRQARRPP